MWQVDKVVYKNTRANSPDRVEYYVQDGDMVIAAEIVYEKHAKLIAIAPELLEALKACVAYINESGIIGADIRWSRISEFEKLIKKVEGE